MGALALTAERDRLEVESMALQEALGDVAKETASGNEEAKDGDEETKGYSAAQIAAVAAVAFATGRLFPLN